MRQVAAAPRSSSRVAGSAVPLPNSRGRPGAGRPTSPTVSTTSSGVADLPAVRGATIRPLPGPEPRRLSGRCGRSGETTARAVPVAATPDLAVAALYPVEALGAS
jgi:hypothetical protein